MTDLEKAKEIANMDYQGVACPKEYVALEMAQWKERQMIQKACEWLEENAILRLVHNDRTLVEKFKKYMEEQ